MAQKIIDKSKRIPLYEQCADVIRARIASGEYAPGEFMPSERLLSVQLGINRITLRKGMAELVRRGLIENVPGAGNRVTGAPRTTVETRTVGFVMLRQVGVPALNPYYAGIVDGIEEVVTEANYDLVHSSLREEDLWTSSGEPLPAEKLVKDRFAGVMLIGGFSDELGIAYRKSGIPVVMVDRISREPVLSTVTPANEQGAYEVTKYLVELGHSSIIFLGAPKDPVVDARLRGVERALEQGGVPFDEEHFIEGDYDTDAARRAMRAYLETEAYELPMAVVAINDEAAIGAYRAVREAGLEIPLDVSVVGFDDIGRAMDVEPQLTTVRVPRRAMGQCAAEILLHQLAEPGSPAQHKVLPTELVVRQSCAAP